MADILAVGEALVEIMRTERDRPLDRPATFAGPYPSGAPAIFASAAARLGGNVGLIGCVGDDAFGDCIRTRLLDDGIDCSGLAVSVDRLTGIAFVSYRSDGGRSFVFHLPHSAAAAVGLGRVPKSLVSDTTLLHIMGSSLIVSESMRATCYALARQVAANGGRVTLDPNLRPELMPLEDINRVCRPILELASVVFPSGEELEMVSGCADPDDGAHALLDQGAELVALKLGDKGSCLYTVEGAVNVAPYSVQEVDPTGAGDCFDAAMVVAMSEAMPLEQAATFANAVGALATTRLGPMEGAFRRDQVLAFMSDQGRPLPQ